MFVYNTYFRKRGKTEIKNLLILIIAILYLCTVFFPINNAFESTSYNIIYVDDDNIDGPWDGSSDHPYNNLQDAINAALNGDIIYVFSGVYSQYAIVNKSVNLVGENKNNTIIDGNSTLARIIQIDVSNVSISNFSLVNSIKTELAQAIYVFNNNFQIKNIKISDCIIKDNGKGIYLNNVTNISITNCDIHNNFAQSILAGKVDNIFINN
ncbi:MAG: DUF1565 domain-containing protein, partial [Promethearchaeota archaeon]